MKTKTRMLLTAVYGPYGVRDEYAEGTGMQMELFNNQITREQGLHSLRQSYWSFGLYLLAENVSVPSTVLDFPTWRDFTDELEQGYTHVGISFIVPNVQKAKRMAEYVRRRHPEIKIILGGYGTVIPELETIVPCDAICPGEGVRWLREYFGDDPDAPLRHPVLTNPAYEYLYGVETGTVASVILPGMGCVNGCDFCITSHKFDKKYVPLISSGKEMFHICREIESTLRCRGFFVMDENFLKSPDRARELLEEMEKNRKLYIFDIFSSAEVIDKLGVDFLVRLGVRMIWIGIESRRMMYGKTRGLDVRALIDKLRSRGIIVITSIILFLDHHDRESLQAEIDWAVSLGSDMTQFMQYTPYPSTALHRRLANEGLLKGLPYRKHHGQDELIFKHSHINNPHEHYELTRRAFRKKYLTDGPVAANIARTLIRGCLNMQRDIEHRGQNGLVWDRESLRYEKAASANGRNGAASANGRNDAASANGRNDAASANGINGPAAASISDDRTASLPVGAASPGPDKFMAVRLRALRTMARGYRPFLLAALVFAPNNAARDEIRKTMALYDEAFGKPSLEDELASLKVLASAAAEGAAIWLNGLFTGKADLIRQPPTQRMEFPGMRDAARQGDVERQTETSPLARAAGKRLACPAKSV